MINVLKSFAKFVIYSGSNFWIPVYLAAVLYIILKKGRKHKAVYVSLIILSAILLISCVTGIVFKNDSIFKNYGIFWIIPVTLICIYALVSFLNQRFHRKTQETIIVFFATVFVLLMQLDFYDISLKGLIYNRQLLSKNLTIVADIIDYSSKTSETVIVAPKEIDMNYALYRPDAVMGIGKSYYTMRDETGEETDWPSYMDLYQKELFTCLVNNGQEQDIQEMKAAIISQEIDYLVVPVNAKLEEYMTILGCEYLGRSKNYQVYHYKYSNYGKTIDPQEAQDIIDNSDIQVNDVYTVSAGWDDHQRWGL